MRSLFRGQGALEYLLSYGWAILTVMVVGLSLWGIGAVSQTGSAMSSMGFTFFKLIQATSNDGYTVLIFQNTLPKEIMFNSTQSKAIDRLSGEVCPPDKLTISPEVVPIGGTFRVLAYCTPDTSPSFDLQMDFIYDIYLGGQTESRGESGRVQGKQVLTPGGPICQAPFSDDWYHKGMGCYRGVCQVDECLANIAVYKAYCRFSNELGDNHDSVISCDCVDGACI